MENKEIVIVHKTCVSDYPPLLAFIKYLKKSNYKVYLILGFEKGNLIEELNELCEKVHYTDIKPSKNKILYWYKIRTTFWKIINKNSYYDKLLWIPAADTTLALGKKLLKYNFVLNLYELFDYAPRYVKGLKIYAEHAKLVICSNQDRANILRVWWKLKETPQVILNKSFMEDTNRNLPLTDDLQKLLSPIINKKKIIYQGIIAPERELDGLCEYINQSDDYALIIMGKETEYLKYLKKLCPSIIHIPFVSPPYHLHVTSHTDVGILSYDHSSLNNIFCAPNKLWEFSSFSIPMLGNDIPGLINTITMNKMGTCIDFSDKEQILNALDDIFNNYSIYAKNAKKFYESYDYDQELDNIFRKLKL
ncbi:hypothetical protein [Empedobacter falsenii]|uniref:hypothetical protein n=1 Tax=Empedobacter falsenii TaxID=343874 RepID=UPI001C8EA408|nr:hypothetical protein [Empedobacter falsenii]MBY0065617.1 hypothetical protein [Empedobacter falsenii]